MPTEDWIRALEDGRLVKFTNQDLPGGGSFITAQIEKHEVVYSIMLDKVKNPLTPLCIILEFLITVSFRQTLRLR